MRLHPAASRVQKLSLEIPASIVFFDLLCEGNRSLCETPFGERRAKLESICAKVDAPLHLTPATRDRKIATARSVRRLVVSQGARVVLIGVVVGVVAAVASTRLLKALLYDVNALDPVVFVAMSIMMIGIGLLASYVPARRASNVNAMESLRSD